MRTLHACANEYYCTEFRGHVICIFAPTFTRTHQLFHACKNNETASGSHRFSAYWLGINMLRIHTLKIAVRLLQNFRSTETNTLHQRSHACKKKQSIAGNPLSKIDWQSTNNKNTTSRLPPSNFATCYWWNSALFRQTDKGKNEWKNKALDNMMKTSTD